MIESTGFRATCDHDACPAERRAPSVGALIAAAEPIGWTFNRRADGNPAKRNGKDYCPVHKRGWHLLDHLTDAMAARLVEMLAVPVWRPRGPGEWRSAQLMHDRGLLTKITTAEGARFELTDAGRRAGLDVRDRLREAAVALEPAGDPEDEGTAGG